MTDDTNRSSGIFSDLSNEKYSRSEHYYSKKQLAVFASAITLVSLLSQIDRMLPFIMIESIKSDLELSDTQVGLFTGLAFALCYALLSLPLARLSDQNSPRLVLTSCILLWSLMTALGGMATSFVMLAGTRLGVAVGEAGAMPSAHAIIARRVRPEQRGMAIGLFAMGIPVGTMLAFAVGGALNEILGWRTVLVAAGATGLVIAGLAFVAIGPTSPSAAPEPGLAGKPSPSVYFRQVSMQLVSGQAFRWLFISAALGGFAAAPFYAFTASFLIRAHGYTSSEAGLAFGLMQGGLGIAGALIGGRMFDRAVRHGAGRLLGPPGLVFVASAFTAATALLIDDARLTLALLVPTMFSFAFMLPWGFGTAHLLAGRGKEAMATSLIMIASGLFGPVLGPLIVGIISDAATTNGMANSLGLGLLAVPIASLLTGTALLITNRKVAAQISSDPSRSGCARGRSARPST